MMKKSIKIILIFMSYIMFIGCSYSQENELFVVEDSVSNDKYVYLYIRKDSHIIKADSFSFFIYDEISYKVDSINLKFYFIGKKLLSTSTISGNNELEFNIKTIKLIGDNLVIINDFKIVSNQQYGDFRDLVISGDQLLFFKNDVVVGKISLDEINQNIISLFFK